MVVLVEVRHKLAVEQQTFGVLEVPQLWLKVLDDLQTLYGNLVYWLQLALALCQKTRRTAPDQVKVPR